MKISGKMSKGVCAAILGAVVAGMPLAAVHAEAGVLSRHGEHRYDVRRGMYAQEGGSDTEVCPGRYVDEENAKQYRNGPKPVAPPVEQKVEEDQEDADREQDEEDVEKEQHEEAVEKEHREEPVAKKPADGTQKEKREYYYNVRRGMYAQEGGSDIEVRRGKYEQPSPDGERRGLLRNNS